MTQQEGVFTIPTRVYLTATQRAKLNQLVQTEKIELGDLITRIVSGYLDELPDVAPPEPPTPDTRAELRSRRMNLTRLRAQRDAQGGAGAAWLNSYIAELEAEIQQLEQQQG